MAKETVTIAKLRRGKSYKFNNDGEFIEFKRNVWKEVSEEVAEELEVLVDRLPVEGTNDFVEVDIFEIERDAQPLESRDTDQTRRRMRLQEEVVPVKRAGKPKLKAPPKGFGKRRSVAA